MTVRAHYISKAEYIKRELSDDANTAVLQLKVDWEDGFLGKTLIIVFDEGYAIVDLLRYRNWRSIEETIREIYQRNNNE